MADLTREENIDTMIQVMSDLQLHLRATRGYKYTGTMVALDGSEDHLICREAKDFWNENNMRARINAAVADVKSRFHAGQLPWNYSTVQSLIAPYPKTGHLDTLKLGQEDEATEDPDGVPWEPEGFEEPAADGVPAFDPGEDENAEVPAFDPADWHDGVDPYAAGGGYEDGEIHGSGENLSASQAEAVLGHSARVQALRQAKDILAI